MQNRIERAKLAYEVRQAGKTLQEVGAIFGVSRERARQMVCRYIRHQTGIKTETDPFLAALKKYPSHVRALNSLHNWGYAGNPQKVADTGAETFIKRRNVGKKTIFLIAQALQDSGYIKSAAAWHRLDEKPQFRKALQARSSRAYRAFLRMPKGCQKDAKTLKKLQS